MEKLRFCWDGAASVAPFLFLGSGLAARDSADEQKWLVTRDNGIRQEEVRGLVGQIFAASEKAQEGAALLRDMVANRPSQHRVGRLERVESRAQRGWTLDLKHDLAANAG